MSIDCNGFNVLDEQAISGYDFDDHSEVVSSAECCDLCSNTPGCDAWTFLENEGTLCSLKSGYTSDDGSALQHDPAAQSGALPFGMGK